MLQAAGYDNGIAGERMPSSELMCGAVIVAIVAVELWLVPVSGGESGQSRRCRTLSNAVGVSRFGSASK